jgi:hypothetical protein
LLGARAEGLGERIGFQLEIFDASAFLFWLENPLYCLTGAGPGLVSLPASYYVPPGAYSIIWNEDVGVNSLPTHGVLLEISNSGLAGLGLWLFQVGLSWKAMRVLGRSHAEGTAQDWRLGRGMFLLGAALYCVQVSVSPVWSIFCGIGWGAALLVDAQRRSLPQFVTTAPLRRQSFLTTSRSAI